MGAGEHGYQIPDISDQEPIGKRRVRHAARLSDQATIPRPRCSTRGAQTALRGPARPFDFAQGKRDDNFVG